MTSIDKALEVCEVLSASPRGLSLSELSRAVRQPPPTVHRLLGVLKRRGYVRQDEETQRYALTLKMLDLSFRAIGRSEVRLHAYPIMRSFVLRSPHRAFIAIPATGEVTYLWSTGPDEVAMHTTRSSGLRRGSHVVPSLCTSRLRSPPPHPPRVAVPMPAAGDPASGSTAGAAEGGSPTGEGKEAGRPGKRQGQGRDPHWPG